MNLVKLTEQYIGKDRLTNLKRSEKIDCLIEELAKKEQWELLLQVLDHLEENNHRKHDDNADYYSADEIMSEVFVENNYIPLEHILKLSSEENWLDIIYSDQPENLHQLTDDPYLMYGLRKLTPKQKEVFYLRAVKGLSNTEIAEKLEKTDRNTRKLYDKAVETMRVVLEGTDKEKAYVTEE